MKIFVPVAFLLAAICWPSVQNLVSGGEDCDSIEDPITCTSSVSGEDCDNTAGVQSHGGATPDWRVIFNPDGTLVWVRCIDNNPGTSCTGTTGIEGTMDCDEPDPPPPAYWRDSWVVGYRTTMCPVRRGQSGPGHLFVGRAKRICVHEC